MLPPPVAPASPAPARVNRRRTRRRCGWLVGGALAGPLSHNRPDPGCAPVQVVVTKEDYKIGGRVAAGVDNYFRVTGACTCCGSTTAVHARAPATVLPTRLTPPVRPFPSPNCARAGQLLLDGVLGWHDHFLRHVLHHGPQRRHHRRPLQHRHPHLRRLLLHRPGVRHFHNHDGPLRQRARRPGPRHGPERLLQLHRRQRLLPPQPPSPLHVDGRPAAAVLPRRLAPGAQRREPRLPVLGQDQPAVERRHGRRLHLRLLLPVLHLHRLPRRPVQGCPQVAAGGHHGRHRLLHHHHRPQDRPDHPGDPGAVEHRRGGETVAVPLRPAPPKLRERHLLPGGRHLLHRLWHHHRRYDQDRLLLQRGGPELCA